MRLLRSSAGAVVAVAIALLALAPLAGASEGGVLVVGDSLEELTSPHLEGLLPGVPLTINAVGGSNSYQIFDLFQESYSPSDSVVVFDAGTNDNPAYPEILAENLRKVAAEIGNRCMVVPTIHGYTVNGVNNRGKNRVVHEFAASRPGTQTPDWAATVNQNPSLLEPDHLHPNPEGAEIRAQLIAEGITACLAGEPTGLPGALPGTVPAAESEAAASQAAEESRPETKHLAMVDRVANRRAALISRLAAGAARGAATFAALTQLLPAG
jgi:lysophospholipase L1-like esterase